MLSRRRLLAGAAATAAGSLLVACGGPRPNGGGPITLILRAGGDPKLVASLLATFSAANPGISVTLTAGQNGGTANAAATLVAGAGPDVLWDTDPTPYLGGKAPLLDLAPLIARGGYGTADFVGPVLDSFRLGPALYMLPRSLTPLCYTVRTDLLAASGADLPAPGYTSTDLAALWLRLTTNGQAIGGKLDWSPTSTFYLRGFGAHLVDPADRTRCALGSVQAAECGQWMWDRFWRDASAQGLQGQNTGDAFAAGTMAMDIVSPTQAVVAAGAYGNIPWQLVPFPRWPAGPATDGQADFYGISAQTAHPEAAWTLLQAIVSSDWEQAEMNAGQVPPARISLWPAYVKTLATLAPPLAQQNLDVFVQAVQGQWTYPTEGFSDNATAQAVLTTWWPRLFGPNSPATVATGLARAAAAVDAAGPAAD